MIRVLWLLALLATAAATATGQPLPVEEFFRRAMYAQPTLSPDGEHLAAIVPAEGHDHLAVVDFNTRKGARITNFTDADVLRYYWINSRRLLFSVGEAHEARGEARFFGWYAVNADGSELRAIDSSTSSGRLYVRGIRYLGPDPRGGDAILIETWRRGERVREVSRYDTQSGRVERLSFDRPPNVLAWMLDRDGVPRVARAYNRGVTTIWYRDGEGSPWIKLDEGVDTDLKIRPLAFDYDNRTLYVGARRDGDKEAIYRYDFARREPGERIARHLDVDMGEMIFSRTKRKLLGVAFDAEKPGVVWIDEDVAKLQAAVDRALPGTFNALRVADQNWTRALVASYSDTAPATYYLFDSEKRTLEKMASSRPWIKPGDMAERRFVRYRSRDGLEIPAYLTVPRNAPGKALPVIVDVHGGPWIGKQSWGFDEEAQFLASRGYAVLQPDFRGTRGYGRQHFVASFGQWGLAMEDDITDGVDWMVREGIADPNRICLMGASYGGYATLWGLIKTPDRYRCGVASAAVTDIGLYFDVTWSDMADEPEYWLEYGARIRIGDPDRDRDKFRSVSPLYQAERLKAPVLLAYGGQDRRVPLKHGNAFRDALDRYGKKYEWVVYPDEGHGFNKDENRFDYYRRVETFLKQHLN